MKKIGKILGITGVIFLVGGIGGMLFDYIFFAHFVNNPVWADSPFVQTMASRYQVIKNTEKVIVENSESIADIASRAATSVVFVEAVSADGKSSSGNGVIVSSDGVIATTDAVVPDGYNTQYVKFADGTTRPVSAMYLDAYSGIVFLKTDVQNLATISFANSDDAQSGKRLISIMQDRSENSTHFSSGGLVGNIYDFSVHGPVSDHLQGTLDVDFSDAVLRENIGSPVVDYQGNMVGLISMKKSVAPSEEAYYAIAANDIYKAFEKYLYTTNATEGQDSAQPILLGVNYAVIGGIDAYTKKLSVDRGAMIVTPATYQETTLFNSTVGAKSGLRGGDVVIMVNNDEVTAKNNLSRLLNKYTSNDTITLKVLRAGEIVTVTISPQA
jgi:S1-C subfamily serine protease